MNKQTRASEVVIPLRENIPAMCQALQLLLHHLLFRKSILSDAEMFLTKEHFRKMLLNVYDPYRRYMEICQRLMLYKEQYCKFQIINPALKPGEWLTASTGYPVTAFLLKCLNNMRKKQPRYRYELKGFTEALLEIGEQPTEENYTFWKQWFTHRGAERELAIFEELGNIMITKQPAI